MKRWGVISVISLLLLITGCQLHSQSNSDGKNISPKTDIKVTREYDEHGNLIRYDSTYIQYYSSDNYKSIPWDSLLNVFRINPLFEDPFLTPNYLRKNPFRMYDSLFFNPFFGYDLFSSRIWRDQQMINELFHEMDSIRNRFFQEFYPPQSRRYKQ